MERTRDIFEELPAFPKPPLVPLPDFDDPATLAQLGLRTGPFARRVIDAVFRLVGFRRFRRRLPERLEDLLRRTNLRGPNLFAPITSATLALEDDPRGVDGITRAATLVLAARGLYRDLTSGRLEPDRLEGEPLEMGQYPNLFSTSVVVDDDGKPRLFKSAKTSRIAVIAARRIYVLDVGEPDAPLALASLRTALASIVERAHRTPLKDGEPAAGLLTCAGHLSQLRFFRRLQKDAVNRRSLAALRETFLTLCLDQDSAPDTHATAALFSHSANGANRWFHASLQLVVFGNARACAICNFSAYLDGNVMVRAAAELQQRARTQPLEQRTSDERSPLSAAEELRWNLGPTFGRRAQDDLRRVQSNEQATFVIPGFGRTVFEKHGVDPVPTFVLALQWAVRRLTGRMTPIAQLLTMSKFRCTDLAHAVVTTPEVARFVEHVDARGDACAETPALLRAAIDSQRRACREARGHLPPTIALGLFLRTSGSTRRFFAVVLLNAMLFLLRRRDAADSWRAQVVISHPELHPEVAVIGRPGVRVPYVGCFGLHYQIWREQIVVTPMPSPRWSVPNAELVAEIRTALERIEQLLAPAASGAASGASSDFDAARRNRSEVAEAVPA
jgi:hypothetical protein